MYADTRQAVGELVINGLDAANQIKRMPVVAIHLWAAGEHRLSETKCAAMTVTDNGIGFTDEVITIYGRVAESAQVGHGRHGVGKFAAFALCSQKNPRYHIVTASGNERHARRFDIDGDVIFRTEGFAPSIVDRSDLPGLPDSGSFAQVVIPDLERSFTAEELIEFLTDHLPHTPWEMTVNGQVVPHRQVKVLESVLVPPIIGVAGQVRIELGKAEDLRHPDSVWLMDGLTLRPVAQVAELPRAVRGLLDPNLLDPVLLGNIFIDGLEDHSSGGRSGLAADFWQGAFGRKLIDIFNGFAAPAARRVLGVISRPDDLLSSQIAVLGDTFSAAFGAPEIPENFKPQPKGASQGGGPSGGEDDEDEEEDGKEPKPRDPSGRQPTPGGGSQRRERGQRRAAFVKIEDKTYQVISFKTGGTVPSSVRKGDVIVVNTDHYDVKRLLRKRATDELAVHLCRILIEAHVANVYGQGEIEQVYRLKAVVEER
ncbi:MAG: ATP-binding protein [Patescibacteria group bacterium]